MSGVKKSKKLYTKAFKTVCCIKSPLRAPRQRSGEGQGEGGLIKYSTDSLPAGANNLEYKNLLLALPGRHQAANAAVALATLNELGFQGWNIQEQSVRNGLASVRWR